jgi:hypothetical protein
MRVLSVQYPKQDVDIKKIDLFNESYKKYQLPIVQDEMKEFSCPAMKQRKKSDVIAPFFTQLKWLAYRNRTLVRREPQAVKARIASTLVVSLMIIALYWKVAEQPYFIAPTKESPSGLNTVEI